MSLDVEGAEMDILKSFPFDKYCIKYATIETNNEKEKEKELEEFMRKRGYKFEGPYKTDHIFSVFLLKCNSIRYIFVSFSDTHCNRHTVRQGKK